MPEDDPSALVMNEQEWTDLVRILRSWQGLHRTLVPHPNADHQRMRTLAERIVATVTSKTSRRP